MMSNYLQTQTGEAMLIVFGMMALLTALVCAVILACAATMRVIHHLHRRSRPVIVIRTTRGRVRRRIKLLPQSAGLAVPRSVRARPALGRLESLLADWRGQAPLVVPRARLRLLRTRRATSA